MPSNKCSCHYQVSSDLIILRWGPGDEETIRTNSTKNGEVLWRKQGQVDILLVWSSGAGGLLMMKPLHLEDMFLSQLVFAGILQHSRLA